MLSLEIRLSFILVNKQNGSRTVFSPSGKSSGQARKYDYLMNPDIILIDGYEYTAARDYFYQNQLTKRGSTTNILCLNIETIKK